MAAHDMLVVFYLILLGLATGVLAGLFGTGGGTFLIPFLLIIFSHMGYSHAFDMHIAIGTSLSLVVPTALSSTVSHYRHDHLDLKLAARWLPSIIIGIIIGSSIIHFVSSIILKIIFSAYLIGCILYNFFKKEHEEQTNLTPSAYLLAPLGLLVGACSTLLGVGGGTFTVPLLNFVKYPLKRALALSSLTALTIGSIAVTIILSTSVGLHDLPRHTLGYMNWLIFLCVAPMTMLFSPVGVHLSNKLSKQTLKMSYTLFLTIILCVMLFHLTQSLT